MDFWANLGSFYKDWKVPIDVVVIIVVAILARIILHFVVARVVNRIVSGLKKRQNAVDTVALQASPLAAVRLVQRTRTLGDVLRNIITVVIVIVATLSIVTTVAPNITGAFALITAALGAGLGFGAQSLVKDILNGLFMVAEDQLGVGDVVDTGSATGVVEGVGIRVTMIRDVNGTLWYVRNGEINRVGNMSQGWARVIIDLAIPYDADIEDVQDLMLATATDLASSAKWRASVLEKPEIWGLESISSEALVIRLVIKTRTAAKDDVARELRIRLKRALDDMGVKLPALNSIVLSGFEGAASVKGAKPPRTTPLPLASEAPAARGRARKAAAAETAKADPPKPGAAE